MMDIVFPVPHFPHYHAEAYDGNGVLYVAILASGGGRSGAIVYTISNGKPFEVLAPGSAAFSAPQLVTDAAGYGHLYSMDQATVLHSWPIPGWVTCHPALFLELAPPWYTFGQPFAPPVARRQGGMVTLAGVVKGGALNTTITTLPQGWRPAEQLDLAVECGGVYGGADWSSMPGRIDIDPSGRVYQVTGGSRWLSLCVSFAAA